MTVLSPKKPLIKENDELEFQNHFAHEKEIYMGLISSSESESSLKKSPSLALKQPKLNIPSTFQREMMNRSALA